MKFHPINWWYRFSLPASLLSSISTPLERERLRRARLTAGILLLIIVCYLIAAPFQIFDSPATPSSPALAFVTGFCLLIAWISGRFGRITLSASFLVLYIVAVVSGSLIANKLDPSLIPIFSTLVVAVVLAGSLMPPVSALIVAFICCLDVIMISTFQPHTASYQALYKDGHAIVAIFLPSAIIIIVAVVVYIIMISLNAAIARADRAEELIKLQKAIREYENNKVQENEQLEEGFRMIANAHAHIANGDLNTRVTMREGHILWPIAGSLNNLLNRLQSMKRDVELLQNTQMAAQQVARYIRQANARGEIVLLNATGTPLDPVIIEWNNCMQSIKQGEGGLRS